MKKETVMNTMNNIEAMPGTAVQRMRQWFAPDMLLLLGLVVIANTHLAGAGAALSGRLVFFPSQVMEGQWWRVFTYPFVHLSWYHLALDAGAFFMLYRGLAPARISTRMLYVVVCGATSLGAALLAAPAGLAGGLTGLSGIAHGLMAVTALEMVREGEQRGAGVAALAVVVIKSMYEAVSGHVVFEFMHMGLCGTPLAVAHAGGVLGGVLAFGALNMGRNLIRN